MRRSTWVLLGVFLAVLALYVVVRPDPQVAAAPATKKVTREQPPVPTPTPSASRSAKPSTPRPVATPSSTAAAPAAPAAPVTPGSPVPTGSVSPTPQPVLPLPTPSP
jgi:hypothetical protein